MKSEKQQFKELQTKLKPRKDDLERLQKIKKDVRPNLLNAKISLSKEELDFLIGIAEQHARISDTTLAALEKHDEATATLKSCQSLYLAVTSEVAALGYSDRSKLTQAVQDVLKGIEDWRAVSWLIDDMTGHKPSTLAEILETRETKIAKKYSFAKKIQDYNQPNPTPQKTKKKSHDPER